MTDDFTPGDELQINASDGTGTVAGPPDPNWARWGVRQRVTQPERWLAAPPDADPRDWRDPRVGWGLVLAENEAIPAAARAAGDDAPEPIRELLAARAGSPVFRFRPDTWTGGYLRRYYPDGSQQDVRITGGETGTGRGQMPRYLLIVGSPEQVPWSVQFRLNVSVCVGRLDLPPEGLRNYVRALISGWADSGARRDAPVVWGVDHGNPDITWLMRQVIAEKVAAGYAADEESRAGVRQLMGGQATAQGLIDALAATPPALVFSTSHGMTGPVADPAAMARNLGLLVDQHQQMLQPADVLARWQPDGAIWYAHACCSAGSDRVTHFRGLVDAESKVGQVLEAVAALGALTAPFPTALLGAERPLGAFVGHVEPTFNWTLRDPKNRQVVTAGLVHALYNRLFAARPEPVGLALERVYDQVGERFSDWRDAVERVNEGDAAARSAATLAQLTALDLQSIVILGDPTVAVRPPAQ
jgi:hypothetical protein